MTVSLISTGDKENNGVHLVTSRITKEKLPKNDQGQQR